MAFPAHVQEAAESCYNVAANELLGRIRMREQLLILNVTASLAIFGLAFRDHSPLLLLVAPHIAFGAVVLFEQQHSIIGAFFRYFEHLGEAAREEAGLPEDFQPWHASRFFVNHIAGGGIYERFVGRSFLFLGPPTGALIFSPLIQLNGEVNQFYYIWYLGLLATLATFWHLYTSEFKRVSSYDSMHFFACRNGRHISYQRPVLFTKYVRHAILVILAIVAVAASIAAWTLGDIHP